MNCLIYPFLSDCKYFYKYLIEQKKEYTIQHIVCPRACKYTVENEFEVETDFDNALNDTDTIIISDISKMPWLYKDTVNKIIDCLENGYKVICCTPLADYDLAKCRDIADESKFEYFGKIPFNCEYSIQTLKSINGVMIGIGMISSGISYTSVFFNLMRIFREKGYTVAGICDRYDSQMINGCYPFPSNIFEENIKDQEKILKLNDYINTVQMKHSADIIILCFPQAMLKYSDAVPDGFGVNSFMVSQAVSIDYFVLTEPLLEAQYDNFEGMNNTFRERYGFEINAIGIDNKTVNNADSKELEKMVYFTIDPKEVDEEVKKYRSMNNGILYFSINDVAFCETIVSDCIADLSGEVEMY